MGATGHLLSYVQSNEKHYRKYDPGWTTAYTAIRNRGNADPGWVSDFRMGAFYCVHYYST